MRKRLDDRTYLGMSIEDYLRVAVEIMFDVTAEHLAVASDPLAAHDRYVYASIESIGGVIKPPRP